MEFVDIQGLLENDHESLDRLLKETFGALDEGDPKLVYERLDMFWARLAMHIRAEHLRLFPELLKNDGAEKLADGHAATSPPEIAAVIAGLKSDHNFFMRELARAVKILRQSEIKGPETSGTLRAVDTILKTVGARLTLHNKIEEQRLYPLANQLSTGKGGELANSIAAELANLPQRFGPNDR